MLYGTNAKQKMESLFADEPIILGIETSCDDTSVAVLRGNREVLAVSTDSQIMTHREFGGVVPEIASRMHASKISPVTMAAVKKAGIKLSDINAIAVTYGPGLLGALLTGVNFAKGLAYSLGVPMVGVNHIMGHICANYLTNENLEPPFVCLVASGGHSQIVHVKSYTEYEILGGTCDDAAGEALDKVARCLGLPYPGGVSLEILAQNGNENAFGFKSQFNLSKTPNFSFSGIKTAVINLMNSYDKSGNAISKEDVAASFQRAVVETLSLKTIFCARSVGCTKVAIAGGVSANKKLRRYMTTMTSMCDMEFYMPEINYCTDNGAMIACAGYYLFKDGITSGLDLEAVATCEFPKH